MHFDYIRYVDVILGSELQTDHYGTNLAGFEEAIRQAHDNGASGITYFTAGSLRDSHLAIIKKFNEAFNR